jgi:hypothetical protein
MENQKNIRKSRGRPKTKTEDENLIALQNRQHNYYLNYKNKKRNVIDDIIQEPFQEIEKEEEEDINKTIEILNNTKQLNELIDQVIIIMNRIKSLN